MNETPADLMREQLVIDRFCELTTLTANKLGDMAYGVDFSLHRPSDQVLHGWAEVKVRSTAYPDVMLSVAKLMAIYRLHAMWFKPAYFVVCRPDGLFVHPVTTTDRELTVVLGGNSRGQNGDIEPVIYIPIGQFSRISDSPIVSW